MRAENVNRERGLSVPAPQPTEPGPARPLDPAYTSAPAPPVAAANEGTFARGGNGIFGEPKVLIIQKLQSHLIYLMLYSISKPSLLYSCPACCNPTTVEVKQLQKP